MIESFDDQGSVPAEICVEGVCLDWDESNWAILKVLDEEGLVKLLCNRMDKSATDVRNLLDSYAPRAELLID